MPARRLYDLVITKNAREVDRVSTHLDIDSESELRAHLVAAVERNNDDPRRELGKYAMEVRDAGKRGTPLITWVALGEQEHRNRR